jgi:hypothetical protein
MRYRNRLWSNSRRRQWTSFSAPARLLYTASATSAMWTPIIEALSSSYSCYRIDAITEANKRVAHETKYSVAGHVDWLEHVFAALGLSSARAMGLPTAAGRTAGAPPIGTRQPPRTNSLLPELSSPPSRVVGQG